MPLTRRDHVRVDARLYRYTDERGGAGAMMDAARPSRQPDESPEPMYRDGVHLGDIPHEAPDGEEVND